MSLYLAFKRVGRFYKPSPRRWIRENYTAISFYTIGLFTGLMASTPSFSSRVNYAFMAAMWLLVAMKWWADKGSTLAKTPVVPVRS
jgi:hypothetical protein